MAGETPELIDSLVRKLPTQSRFSNQSKNDPKELLRAAAQFREASSASTSPEKPAPDDNTFTRSPTEATISTFIPARRRIGSPSRLGSSSPTRSPAIQVPNTSPPRLQIPAAETSHTPVLALYSNPSSQLPASPFTPTSAAAVPPPWHSVHPNELRNASAHLLADMHRSGQNPRQAGQPSAARTASVRQTPPGPQPVASSRWSSNPWGGRDRQESRSRSPPVASPRGVQGVHNYPGRVDSSRRASPPPSRAAQKHAERVASRSPASNPAYSSPEAQRPGAARWGLAAERLGVRPQTEPRSRAAAHHAAKIAAAAEAVMASKGRPVGSSGRVRPSSGVVGAAKSWAAQRRLDKQAAAEAASRSSGSPERGRMPSRQRSLEPRQAVRAFSGGRGPEARRHGSRDEQVDDRDDAGGDDQSRSRQGSRSDKGPPGDQGQRQQDVQVTAADQDNPQKQSRPRLQPAGSSSVKVVARDGAVGGSKDGRQEAEPVAGSVPDAAAPQPAAAAAADTAQGDEHPFAKATAQQQVLAAVGSFSLTPRFSNRPSHSTVTTEKAEDRPSAAKASAKLNDVELMTNPTVLHMLGRNSPGSRSSIRLSPGRTSYPHRAPPGSIVIPFESTTASRPKSPLRFSAKDLIDGAVSVHSARRTALPSVQLPGSGRLVPAPDPLPANASASTGSRLGQMAATSSGAFYYQGTDPLRLSSSASPAAPHTGQYLPAHSNPGQPQSSAAHQALLAALQSSASQMMAGASPAGFITDMASPGASYDAGMPGQPPWAALRLGAAMQQQQPASRPASPGSMVSSEGSSAAGSPRLPASSPDAHRPGTDRARSAATALGAAHTTHQVRAGGLRTHSARLSVPSASSSQQMDPGGCSQYLDAIPTLSSGGGSIQIQGATWGRHAQLDSQDSSIPSEVSEDDMMMREFQPLGVIDMNRMRVDAPQVKLLQDGTPGRSLRLLRPSELSDAGPLKPVIPQPAQPVSPAAAKAKALGMSKSGPLQKQLSSKSSGDARKQPAAGTAGMKRQVSVQAPTGNHTPPQAGSSPIKSKLIRSKSRMAPDAEGAQSGGGDSRKVYRPADTAADNATAGRGSSPRSPSFQNTVNLPAPAAAPVAELRLLGHGSGHAIGITGAPGALPGSGRLVRFAQNAPTTLKESIRLFQMQHGDLQVEDRYEVMPMGQIGTESRTHGLIHALSMRTAGAALGHGALHITPDIMSAQGVIPYPDEPQAAHYQGAYAAAPSAPPLPGLNYLHSPGHVGMQQSLAGLSHLTVLSSLQQLSSIAANTAASMGQDDPSLWPQLMETTPSTLKETAEGWRKVGPAHPDPGAYAKMAGMVPQVVLDFPMGFAPERLPAAPSAYQMQLQAQAAHVPADAYLHAAQAGYFSARPDAYCHQPSTAPPAPSPPQLQQPHMPPADTACYNLPSALPPALPSPAQPAAAAAAAAAPIPKSGAGHMDVSVPASQDKPLALTFAANIPPRDARASVGDVDSKATASSAPESQVALPKGRFGSALDVVAEQQHPSVSSSLHQPDGQQSEEAGHAAKQGTPPAQSSSSSSSSDDGSGTSSCSSSSDAEEGKHRGEASASRAAAISGDDAQEVQEKQPRKVKQNKKRKGKARGNPSVATSPVQLPSSSAGQGLLDQVQALAARSPRGAAQDEADNKADQHRDSQDVPASKEGLSSSHEKKHVVEEPVVSAPSPALAMCNILNSEAIESKARQTLDEWKAARLQAAAAKRQAAAAAIAATVTSAAAAATINTGSAVQERGMATESFITDMTSRSPGQTLPGVLGMSSDAPGAGTVQQQLMVALLAAMTGGSPGAYGSSIPVGKRHEEHDQEDATPRAAALDTPAAGPAAQPVRERKRWNIQDTFERQGPPVVLHHAAATTSTTLDSTSGSAADTSRAGPVLDDTLRAGHVLDDTTRQQAEDARVQPAAAPINAAAAPDESDAISDPELAKELLQLILTAMKEPDQPFDHHPATAGAQRGRQGAGSWLDSSTDRPGTGHLAVVGQVFSGNASLAGMGGAGGLGSPIRQDSHPQSGAILLTEAFYSGRLSESMMSGSISSSGHDTAYRPSSPGQGRYGQAAGAGVYPAQGQHQPTFLHVSDTADEGRSSRLPAVLPNPSIPRGTGSRFLQVLDIVPVAGSPGSPAMSTLGSGVLLGSVQNLTAERQVELVRQRMQQQLDAAMQLPDVPFDESWRVEPVQPAGGYAPQAPSAPSAWGWGAHPASAVSSPRFGASGHQYDVPVQGQPVVAQMVAAMPHVYQREMPAHTTHTFSIDPPPQQPTSLPPQPGPASAGGAADPSAASGMTVSDRRRKAELDVWLHEMKGLSQAVSRAELAQQVAAKATQHSRQAAAQSRGYQEGILSALTEVDALAQEIEAETTSTRELVEELSELAELDAARQYHHLVAEARHLTQQVEDILNEGQADKEQDEKPEQDTGPQPNDPVPISNV